MTFTRGTAGGICVHHHHWVGKNDCPRCEAGDFPASPYLPVGGLMDCTEAGTARQRKPIVDSKQIFFMGVLLAPKQAEAILERFKVGGDLAVREAIQGVGEGAALAGTWPQRYCDADFWPDWVHKICAKYDGVPYRENEFSVIDQMSSDEAFSFMNDVRIIRTKKEKQPKPRSTLSKKQKAKRAKKNKAARAARRRAR